jgi:hypothetical protein
MATTKVYLPEIMRIWAQWLGLGLAAIPCGLALGILLRYGVGQVAALAFALPIGFVLAVVFWTLIGRWVAVRPIEYTICACSDTLSLDRAGAFAVAMLCITLHSYQPPSGVSGHSTLPSAIHDAIPQL